MKKDRNSIESAKRKLFILYCISMGVILTVALLAVYLMNYYEQKQNRERLFQNCATSVYVKLQSDDTFTNTWISNMEHSNELILYFEDNGVPLKQWGSYVTEEKREKEIALIKQKAQQDNLNMNVRPVSSEEGYYRTYQGRDEEGKEYYALAVVIPYDSAYRSAIMIQYFSELEETLRRMKRWFIMVEVLGLSCVIFLNVIYIKHTMKPIEISNKRQKEFISAASHELKSPLTVIQSSAIAIAIAPEKTRQYITTIDQECLRMAKLVDDMLILASTESKTWRVHMSEIELDTLLLDLYEEYTPVCRQAGMKLELDLPEEMLPKIHGDAFRLKQVLLILLNNALQYSQSKKPIQLKACVSKHYVFLKVIDYGIGIPSENQELVFQKFYQVDSSHTSKEHYGLGLSIAKELVHMHNGLLFLEDTPGGGCTFTIKLPMN